MEEDWLIDAFVTILSSSIPAERFAQVSSDIMLLTGELPRAFGSCMQYDLVKAKEGKAEQTRKALGEC